MKHTLQDLYREHGFTVTPYLHDLILTYGSSVVSPVSKPDDASMIKDGPSNWSKALWEQIEFCPYHNIVLGSSCGFYKAVSAFMGSPVAPVGETQRRNIELMLTEDGRLIGTNDYMVMFWGEEGCDWRTSLAAYLAGAEPVVLGDA